jgi:alkylated DNA repair dioxygenase AlkB
VIIPQGDPPAVHGLISLLTSEVRLCFVAWGEGDVGLGVLSKTTLPLLPTSMQCDFANLCEAQKALSSSVLASCTSLRSTLTSATMEYQTSLCSSLSSVIDVHLASLVREFCGPLLSQHSSSNLLDWLFKSSVLSSSLHGTSLAHLSSSDLQEELLQERFVDFGNRLHLLKAYAHGRVYYWPRSPILRSSPFGPELFAFTSSLMGQHLWMHQTKECLLTLYADEDSHLNFHSDLFNNKPETVILFFIGGPRNLQFKTKSAKFSRSLKCDPNSCVILTPLANSIFLHAKSTALSDYHLSLSIAYRATLSVTEACLKFPKVQRRLGVSPNGLSLLMDFLV